MPFRSLSLRQPPSLRTVCTLGLAILLVALSLQGSERANAAEQHANANVYAFWKFDPNSGFRDVEQKVKVREKAPFTFWAQFWRWTGQDVGGYVDLQTDGNRFDGSTGETARRRSSLSGMQAARKGRGAALSAVRAPGTAADSPTRSRPSTPTA